ncbi:hypothetical protein QBC38DRAFT_155740 [Podospora fimiseda]|uniref:Uncharacterized protein n=1 Tax=Podospora fimiseda TaxID=252190 RepID=A0AAN7H5I4_9PEZI|nr:hypothetical protein QBC38DRAFT_155740 [Podospora fimiseda]
MTSLFHFAAPQHHPSHTTAPFVSHSHHGGRNRRAPRLSVSQNPQHKQQYRKVNGSKDVAEYATVNAFRSKFELVRSFDLEDDMEFCPSLCSDSDYASVSNSASERSSLASNSPQGSPTQQPTQVVPFPFQSGASPVFVPQYHQHTTLKLHQPAATRSRNAIPIINPATGGVMSSPPPSVSPARMQQQTLARRW